MSISIEYLQKYIRSKDHDPARKEQYFLKLSEEVGELARAMHRNMRPESAGQIKGTVEEELWDVIYYVIALANLYDIDLESVIPLKEKVNNDRYNKGVIFGAEIAEDR